MISRRKRIAVCSAQIPFLTGGAERLVIKLLQELKQRGYDVESIMLPFKWYPNEQMANSMFIWKLIDLSESDNKKIDLVIPTKFPSYLIQHDNKVVWLVHQYRQIYDLYGTKYSWYNESYKPIMDLIKQEDEKALSETNKIFCISKNVANRLKNFNSIDGETLYHPPMLYGKYFHERYEDYVLAVGRLDALKRIDMLIKSIRYTEKKIRFLIAGTGVEKDSLEKLAIQEGVSDRVVFFGSVSDEKLLKLYANASAVYYAPVDEDYGYVTLEALLSKVPVITTKDSGGVLEFIRDDNNGYIVDSNPEKLGEAINKIVMNKKLAQNLGENGYTSVKDISWNNVIDRLTETLR